MSGCADGDRFVTSDKCQTLGEAELQIPEGDPDCPTCRRTLELIQEALGEVGRLRQETLQVQQETLQYEQRTRELNAQIEELKGRASGAAAKSGRRSQSRRQKRRRR